MIFSNKDIKKEIQGIYPRLQWAMFTDKKYLKPAKAEVDGLLAKSINDSLPYIQGIYECEEFAFGFMVDVRRVRAKEAIDVHERYYNWAVGVVLVKFASTQVHWANIIVTSDNGILYVDAEKKKLQTLNEIKGEVHYLIM